MTDLNGTTPGTMDDLGRFVNKNLANYKKASIGGNLRVGIQQPTAVIRAWPVSGTVTSEFGYRSQPTAGASTNHPAIDIGVSSGTPVKAADGGTVISAGYAGGYGKQIAIDHGNGYVTYYSHLSWWDAEPGDKVKKGQYIGKLGNTGTSTGPHLDFKITKNGTAVNPRDYLN